METAIGVRDVGVDHVIQPGHAVFQRVVDPTTGTMREAQIGQCGRRQGEAGQSIWGIAQTELSFDIGAVVEAILQQPKRFQVVLLPAAVAGQRDIIGIQTAG